MPLPILAISALASGASAAFQFINGIKQRREAADIKVPPRPVYDVPGSVKEAVGVARNQANGPMPGMGQAVAKIGSNTASTVSAAQQSGSANNALAVIAAAGNNADNATNDLYTKNAQFQRQGAQALMSQLGTQAHYEDKAWDWNKKGAYQEAAAAKSALSQAGLTNMNNGLAGIGSAVTQGARGFMKGAAPGTPNPALGTPQWSMPSATSLAGSYAGGFGVHHQE